MLAHRPGRRRGRGAGGRTGVQPRAVDIGALQAALLKQGVFLRAGAVRRDGGMPAAPGAYAAGRGAAGVPIVDGQ